METKQRVVQEYVPGKQVTLAHLIANPDANLCELIGLGKPRAVGIMTLTPSETTIIAGDFATKAANVSIGFLDRFTGSLVITGELSAVETALTQIVEFLSTRMGYSGASLTRS
ncbi:MAG TPA: BMC domain-containing protein [Symbiobacteriaceae bacterium]|nr:BMC domain-containing protein [Symbiobacteriaceae bacterium]